MASIRKLATGAVPDLLMVTGAVGISYGAWLIYAPSGFIVSGVLSITFGVMAARGSR